MQKFSCHKEHVHIVGIGGIGVSALARYYLSEGIAVSGSDLVSTEITDELQSHGVSVAIGKHSRKNISKKSSRVVYTAATQKDNQEILEAKRRKIPVQSYAQAVGELTKKYTTITVSGSHGKSTTTALAALALEEGYLDPTVIVGTKLKEFGGHNFRKGHGSHFLLEADEWNKSFLKYHPTIAIVTNIDVEHLDTFKNERGIIETFATYLSRVPNHGAIIANRDDPRLFQVAKKFGKRVAWYSLDSREKKLIQRILKIPGEHNLSNALAVLQLGRILGIHDPAILRGLSRFHGTWRRFEFKGTINGVHLFDDYGHHPREIMATIRAARQKFPFRRIWCVYQPHQFQRLHYLWEDFQSAFDLADRVCLLPVYDVVGRETKKAKVLVNSEKLAATLTLRGKHAVHLPSFSEAEEYILKETRSGDIVIIMGAGDIYTLTKSILDE